MEGEQTWPTDEELADAEARVAAMNQDQVDENDKKKKGIKMRRVPKGTSEYQAAWILPSDDEESDDGKEEGEEDVNMVVSSFSNALGNTTTTTDNNAKAQGSDINSDVESDIDDEEFEDLDANGAASGNAVANPEDEDELDNEEEGRQYQAYLAAKKREQECEDDLEFPDEVDTPTDLTARIRFQKYRGLKSFRTSPWDAYENLPVDYSRIFQFKNFGRTRKRVFNELLQENADDEDECVVSSGLYVTIHLVNVPMSPELKAQASSSCSSASSSKKPIVLFSLLPHENKMSVINFSVTRPSINSIAESLAHAAAKDADMASILGSTNTKAIDSASNAISVSMSSFKLPAEYIVKSKDPLLLCVGHRRYTVRPVYSSNTRGGTNNVHKFERFLQPGRTCIGTVYAPIQFAPCPITLFRVPGLEEEEEENQQQGSGVDLDARINTDKGKKLTGEECY